MHLRDQFFSPELIHFILRMSKIMGEIRGKK